MKRSHRELSESDFNDVLKQIAEKHRAGVDQLASSEIQSFMGFDADSQVAFRELATGGVLDKKGTQWKVSESRLPMGLGLLLSDDLGSAEGGADLKEIINKWLEPHAGADMSGLISEYAVLASVSQGAPSATITALLQAWVETQNPRSPRGAPGRTPPRSIYPAVPRCLRYALQVCLERRDRTSLGPGSAGPRLLLLGFGNLRKCYRGSSRFWKTG